MITIVPKNTYPCAHRACTFRVLQVQQYVYCSAVAVALRLQHCMHFLARISLSNLTKAEPEMPITV